jgi:regulation of enolase protein 1 (concanavalin A-like superfamily)
MSGKAIPEIKTVVADCGTVVLRKGESAQTSVTAALTDDSFYDISKAKVVYSSNNPLVAEVDKNGKVMATGTGVATIFAHVTVNGKTKSDGFPVKVMPDLKAASIKVNNKAVKGFSPETKQYSFLIKSSSDKAPVVEVSANDANVEVKIEQAVGVPGTAVISLIDHITFDKNEYAVNFGVASESDEFEAAELGKQWNIVRKKADNLSLTKQGGSLVITSAKGGIAGESNDAENMILQSANTDWIIETKIVCSRKPTGFSENAGLVAYQDDDNFVKMVYKASFGRRGFGQGAGEQPGAVELSVENGGDEKSTVNISMADIIKDDNTLVLKLVKKGDAYTAYCSADGKKFEEVGKAHVVLKNIQTGMLACDGVMPARMARFRRFMPQNNQPKSPFEVAFDYFRVENSGLK